MAIILTVIAKGQVTLREEVPAHLGAGPGDKLEVDLLADKRMRIRSKDGTSVAAVFDILAKPQASLSVEGMNEIAASAWASQE